MEFLVEIEVNWPNDSDEELKQDLIRDEAIRAKELIEEGYIIRLWRIPGRWTNVGLWRAKNASILHEALSSLPFFPWLDISVRPLAEHPSDPEKN